MAKAEPKKVAAPRFAKNAEGLARVFFPELKDNPRKLKNALKKFILPWLEDETFPRKTKHGYDIAACKQWRATYRETEAAPPPSPVVQPDLPPREGGAETSFLSPQEGLRARLELLKDMYLNPHLHERKIAQWEVKELREHCPEIWKKSEEPVAPAAEPVKAGAAEESPREAPSPAGATLPDAESQVMLARLLARHFSGRVKIDISEQQISNWKAGHHLPKGAPLPPTKIGNRHETQKWADWIERWILPIYGIVPGLQGEFADPTYDVFQQAQRANAQKQIDDARRARVEADEAERRLSDKWIELSVATRLCAGALRQLGDYWRTRNEKTMVSAFEEQARQRGVPGDVAALLKDWLAAEHRKFTDDVENKVQAEADRYAAQVQAEADQKAMQG